MAGLRYCGLVDGQSARGEDDDASLCSRVCKSTLFGRGGRCHAVVSVRLIRLILLALVGIPM